MHFESDEEKKKERKRKESETLDQTLMCGSKIYTGRYTRCLSHIFRFLILDMHCKRQSAPLCSSVFNVHAHVATEREISVNCPIYCKALFICKCE